MRNFFSPSSASNRGEKKRYPVPFFVSAILVTAAVGWGQTTQPAGGAVDAAVELRAGQAFARHDYTQALPMLLKEADALSADPARSTKLAIVRQQIEICRKSMPAVSADTEATASAAAPVDTSAAMTASATTARTPHPKPKPDEVLDLEIKDLGNFEFDPDHPTALPADVLALDGATVRLHGFMTPMDQADRISKFALTPSLGGCCQFGQPPQIQHTILVTCPAGKSVGFTMDEIVVQGKLTVKLVEEEGFVTGIFAVQTTSVKVAPQ